MVLERIGERRHLFLVCDLCKRALSFSPLSTTLAAEFLVHILYKVEEIPPFQFTESFYDE